ncbi:nucleotide exchange factor GrpE [Candidatus Woesearchaeota archaeon]|nr:nucleotide exchange factor GrpE [Candidatus Woesearchaeota archaeon]
MSIIKNKEKKAKEDKCAEKIDEKDDAESKMDELVNDLKRVQAEFENYKKRIEKENTRMCEYSKANIIKKLLTVLDSFEIALKNTENNVDFVKGVELIYSQFHTILSDDGLRSIEAEGKRFDPYMHEVMLSVPSEEPDETIIEELQKGYMLKDLVLRHSKVKISKNEGK